ncbi:MAG: electron transport complex subunit RsxB [Candidatus Competibacteraceae bacterium]
MFEVEPDPLVERIDALLPQTQCRQCGFAGCHPYAQAIAVDRADINQCPPGGEAVIQALAALLNRTPKPLNPKHGVHQPGQVAVIDEQDCIGCTLCIQACPVDAILGAAKQMHTIIAQECTGCELCLPPCPVDCIKLQPARSPEWDRQRADLARRRHVARLARLERDRREKEARLRNKAAVKTAAVPTSQDELKQAIQAAVARVKAKKAALVARDKTIAALPPPDPPVVPDR